MKDDHDDTDMNSEKGRLGRRLDKMVKAGRVTPEEAAQLGALEGPDAEGLVRETRARHVGERLDGAVADGTLTREEADDAIRQVRAGAHPRALRSHLSLRRRGRRSDSDG